MTYFHSYRTTKSKTFKPKKNVPEGTKQYQLQEYAKATLGSGNLKLAAILPEGEDINEWLAVNTYEFYNQINLLYGTIAEFCTPQECPVMSAGPKVEYLWSDNEKYKKPVELSAPDYVNHLMEWVQRQLDDESMFPSNIGEEAHLNTSFKHFIYFVQEFQLIEKKELQPLHELIVTLTSQD
ncbi:5280_t:CDS:2 [Acaulospora colombiana]|uniref:5280_t:CDS:1 n=1 Tax=Acaulospora colombiana TaxID=27376 RepID=A0ACA9LYR0_9GLOM|nr:5280_t:CDS:2 [Acaulospora colombiana]